MSPGSSAWLARLADESGFTAIVHSCRDTKVLCLQRFVRLFAYGASFLILVHFLSSLGISDERIGVFMTLTLLGDVVISFLLTAVTDQVGRRKILAAGAALMVMSGLVFSFVGNYWVLVVASIFGVISPSGNEIGPFRAVEESILAQLTEREHRSDIFAWYTLFGTAGAALGTLTCGWVVQALENSDSWTQNEAYRAVFLIYATLGIAKLLLIFGLSSRVEATPPKIDSRNETAADERQGLLSRNSGDENDEPRHSTDERENTPTSMDQAPRQAFLAAAVLPNERTAVLGVVNIVKTLAQAGGIGSAGFLSGRNLWVVVMTGAGIMKACYDLLMLGMFLGLRDREEASSGKSRSRDEEENQVG
ncbi:putative membrane protein [Colletotrichum chlorophyti]|uniref:Putative membrane protein n=1 Tax=Colletotrichum chlorophyti TaxID=708187 RepID=A0A1Q8RWL0_9PEZI|nr:putative membrane protein [Colletotrichum chlorophyti]